MSSFQAVGTLLVFGLLVGPPATAALLVRRVWLMMLVAVALGWLAVVRSAWSSATTTAPRPGATMAGVSVALFFVVLPRPRSSSPRCAAPTRATSPPTPRTTPTRPADQDLAPATGNRS